LNCGGRNVFKLKLVSDIPAHLKRHTIRGLAAIAALQPIWLGVDASIKGGLPLWLTLTINSVIAVAVLGLGFVRQAIAPEAFFNEIAGHEACVRASTGEDGSASFISPTNDADLTLEERGND